MRKNLSQLNEMKKLYSASQPDVQSVFWYFCYGVKVCTHGVLVVFYHLPFHGLPSASSTMQNTHTQTTICLRLITLAEKRVKRFALRAHILTDFNLESGTQTHSHCRTENDADAK